MYTYIIYKLECVPRNKMKIKAKKEFPSSYDVSTKKEQILTMM